MMNRTRRATIGLALLLGAGMVGMAGAQGMHGGGMHGGGHGGVAKGGMMENCPMMGSQSRTGKRYGKGPGSMRGGVMDPRHGEKEMMRRLDLDDDQRMQFRELRSEHRREEFARKADMMDLRDEMQELMAGDRPDPERVRELHGRMADVHGDMLADRIRLRNEMRDRLTDEQREQLRERRHRPGGMMHGRPGMRGDMMQQ